MNNLIGDTSQQEVSNTTTSSIGDTSQQEVNNACSSTPEHSVSSNPLVLSGIVPASVMESLIFTEFNIRGKNPPRVNTKARMMTSDEHVEKHLQPLPLHFLKQNIFSFQLVENRDGLPICFKSLNP